MGIKIMRYRVMNHISKSRDLIKRLVEKLAFFYDKKIWLMPKSGYKKINRSDSTIKYFYYSNIIWLCLSGLVIVLDQISKFYVSHFLNVYEAYPVTSFFNLTLSYNQGAAFSFLHGAQHINLFFILFSSVMTLVMIFFLLRTKTQHRLGCLAWSLIIGGAIGNIIDRLHIGAVIDFLHFYWRDYHFAIFNLADSAICLGALLLAIYLQKE